MTNANIIKGVKN